jgi:hypothetical protein
MKMILTFFIVLIIVLERIVEFITGIMMNKVFGIVAASVCILTHSVQGTEDVDTGGLMNSVQGTEDGAGIEKKGIIELTTPYHVDKGIILRKPDGSTFQCTQDLVEYLNWLRSRLQELIEGHDDNPIPIKKQVDIFQQLRNLNSQKWEAKKNIAARAAGTAMDLKNILGWLYCPGSPWCPSARYLPWETANHFMNLLAGWKEGNPVPAVKEVIRFIGEFIARAQDPYKPWDLSYLQTWS